jgi:hypothetical protein
MTSLSGDTSLHALIEEYPFLVQFLADYNPKFSLLKNPVMRATAGRVATLRTVSEMGNVDLRELIDALGGEIARRMGTDWTGPGEGL